MSMAWLLGILLLICIAVAELDEKVVEKDLYNVLGLNSTATTSEIKKAYRKLATLHHPDKQLQSGNNGANKELSAEIFRSIAEANEVLSSSDTRQEYDMLRSHHSQNQRRQYGGDRRSRSRGQEEMYEEHINHMHRHQQQQFMNEFFNFNSEQQQQQQQQQQQDMGYEQGYEKESIGHPELTQSFLRAGEVLFPYSPIMVSADHSHFLLLDSQCSLGVYRGDVSFLLQLLEQHGPVDMQSVLRKYPNTVKAMWQTAPNPRLRGSCFAGLDPEAEGVLGVFYGHPDGQYQYQPVWLSMEQDAGRSPRHRHRGRVQFYLELQDSGELVVLSLEHGQSDVQCVWSTFIPPCQRGSSNNPFLSQIGPTFREIVDLIVKDGDKSGAAMAVSKKAALSLLATIRLTVIAVKNLVRFLDNVLDAVEEKGALEVFADLLTGSMDFAAERTASLLRGLLKRARPRPRGNGEYGL